MVIKYKPRIISWEGTIIGFPFAGDKILLEDSTYGKFLRGEIVTGQTSNASLTLQSDVLGFKAVRGRDITAVKQIGMAGSPAYTADTSLTSTHGTNTTLTGNITVANSDATVFGKGTNFTNDICEHL